MRLATFGLLALGFAGPALAQTNVCTTLGGMPQTISSSGVYCLDRNRSYSAANAAAITVSSDNVVVELNGFTLDCTVACIGTTASGVTISGNKTNVTVRGGTIRGFNKGIQLAGTGQDHLVENVRVEGSKNTGINVEGRGSVVRGNQVLNTAAASGDAVGIRATGIGVRVTGNDVVDTIGAGVGVGKAIVLETAGGAVVEGNRPANGVLAIGSRGIDVISGSDVLVIGNSLSVLDSGVVFSGGDGKYRDNLSSGVATPYTGGTDAGNNQ